MGSQDQRIRQRLDHRIRMDQRLMSEARIEAYQPRDDAYRTSGGRGRKLRVFFSLRLDVLREEEGDWAWALLPRADGRLTRPSALPAHGPL